MEHFAVGRAQHSALHIIEGSSRIRAELARIGHAIGYHCEVYGDAAEMAAHPPRSGIMLVRDRASDANGVRAIAAALEGQGSWLPIIAYDDAPRPSRVVQAAKAGALDFLEYPIEPVRLERCLDRVARQADGYCMRQQRKVIAQEKIGRLSPREREVLDYLSEGNSNKMMARELKISPRTVEIHRAKMMNKIGASHAAEAVRIRIESGLEQAASA